MLLDEFFSSIVSAEYLALSRAMDDYFREVGKDLSINNHFACGSSGDMLLYMKVFDFVENDFDQRFDQLTRLTTVPRLGPMLCRAHESILKYWLNEKAIKVNAVL